jgi:RimJ/RimL family protein N-acetyltransferase
MNYIEEKKFSEIDLNDDFFDSLKEDYKEFEDWYSKKIKENAKAFILKDKGRLQAFLYLKEEYKIEDISPKLPDGKKVKIGTFKVNPHGTRLGERFIKIAIDYAYEHNAKYLYVTIFEKHKALIKLFERFGFIKHGKKGDEAVYIKELFKLVPDIEKRYPLIKINDNTNIYVLGIRPEYHTRLFPDSKLKTETSDELIVDIGFTNGIYKNYIARIKGLENLKKGDVLIIYRTKDKNKPNARYSSVLTSLCVVLEAKHQDEFASFNEFFRYCKPYTVYEKEELEKYYNSGNAKVVKMTYNIAFKKRLIKKYIEENFGVPDYWGFFPISKEFLKQIIIDAGIDERLIIGL